MASSELGSLVQSAITATSVVADSREEITDEFRNVPPRRAPMATVITSIKTSLGKVWVSRKRIRHDALQLIKEGVTFS